MFSDFEDNGYVDLLLASNNYQSKIKTSRADTGIGSYLKGNDEGDFQFIPNFEHGFFAYNDVKNMLLVDTK